MAVNVNKRIINKVKKSDINDCIKGFLREILIFELQHFEEARPRYSDKYEELIKKYSNKFKEQEK